MRISDWSSDVCSSDLRGEGVGAFPSSIWPDCSIQARSVTSGGGAVGHLRALFGLFGRASSDARIFEEPTGFPDRRGGLLRPRRTAGPRGRCRTAPWNLGVPSGFLAVVSTNGGLPGRVRKTKTPATSPEIGRASCRERVCQYV